MYLEVNLLLYNISPYGFRFPHLKERFFFLFENLKELLLSFHLKFFPFLITFALHYLIFKIFFVVLPGPSMSTYQISPKLFLIQHICAFIKGHSILPFLTLAL